MSKLKYLTADEARNCARRKIIDGHTYVDIVGDLDRFVLSNEYKGIVSDIKSYEKRASQEKLAAEARSYACGSD